MENDEIRVEPNVSVEGEPSEAVTCDPIPLKQWIAEEAPGELCRPCVLPVGMAWYYGELRDKGLGDLADQLDRVKESGDPGQVAALMDELKAQVPEEVRSRLRDFDCAMQVNVQADPNELEGLEQETEG